ncbi:IclR family transcriptional regulator [Candidatus Binatus sp.]|jgi:DNA-binding IclR family transcriptional regulator|uniref:IclR family transcriptional regulator n=1 Tax=Candidatus Binatus sp. TaxID=2811406 RepID=UPI003C4CB1F0
MVRRDKTNYVIQSVSHSLDVLEQFFGEVDELGVTELSKRLKLHKNNVFRLLATLEARGYIEQNKATENYRLGIKCLHLGRRYIHHMGLVRQARPILADVAKKCRESAYVAIVRRDGVVPLEAAEAEDRAVRITPPIGITLPLHCTAAGKAHLAFDAEEQLKSALPESLKRYTDRTIVDRATLLAQLEAVARDGYAVDSGEFIEEVSSIAVPIRDYTRSVVGSVAVAGPTYRIGPERITAEIAPSLLEAGRELSHRLGYNE